MADKTQPTLLSTLFDALSSGVNSYQQNNPKLNPALYMALQEQEMKKHEFEQGAQLFKSKMAESDARLRELNNTLFDQAHPEGKAKRDAEAEAVGAKVRYDTIKSIMTPGMTLGSFNPSTGQATFDQPSKATPPLSPDQYYTDLYKKDPVAANKFLSDYSKGKGEGRRSKAPENFVKSNIKSYIDTVKLYESQKKSAQGQLESQGGSGYDQLGFTKSKGAWSFADMGRKDIYTYNEPPPTPENYFDTVVAKSMADFGYDEQAIQEERDNFIALIKNQKSGATPPVKDKPISEMTDEELLQIAPDAGGGQ